jgi:DNA (cytosine-5)-methyltransferase 1
VNNTFYAADLFCGAGGTSTGLLQAAEARGRSVEMVAVNHWETAVKTHSKNHPNMNHLCADLDSLNPRKAVPGGYLDLLWASPECTHHSNARGGKPMEDQSRATAWCVLRWAEALHIKTIMIENVREFVEWGPLYPADHADPKKAGRPIPSERGKFFRNFLRNLRCLGYTVDWRLLNCADFGDATTRKRFFLMARKGRHSRMGWPAQSHFEPGALAFSDEQRTWVPARDIIDWNLLGTSIFGRKRPLKENTLRRIFAGLEKFNGLSFCLGQQSGAAPRSVNDPLPTISAAGAISLTQPMLIVFRNNCDSASLGRPLPTVCTSPGHFGLLQPYLMAMEHASEDSGDSRRCHSLDKPLMTITSKGLFGVCSPYLIGAGGATGQQSPQDIDAPLGTILADDRRALIHPYLIEYHGGSDGHRRTRDLNSPMPTMDTSNRFGLCQPFLVSYYGNGQALSVDDPVDTIPTRDRFGLAHPILEDGTELRLDILFRMLAPHELAAAHSFPSDYQFAGNRDDIVRQIGNSVPVRTAAALCGAAIGN